MERENKKPILDMPTPAEQARKRLVYVIQGLHREGRSDHEFMARVYEALAEYDDWQVRTIDHFYRLAVDEAYMRPPAPIMVELDIRGCLRVLLGLVKKRIRSRLEQGK